MVELRRLVAEVAGVVMVGVLAAPSGAVAAPLSTQAPVVPAESSGPEQAGPVGVAKEARQSDGAEPSANVAEAAPRTDAIAGRLDVPRAGVAGLALTGIAVLFGAAWILGSRRAGRPKR